VVYVRAEIMSKCNPFLSENNKYKEKPVHWFYFFPAVFIFGSRNDLDTTGSVFGTGVLRFCLVCSCVTTQRAEQAFSPISPGSPFRGFL